MEPVSMGNPAGDRLSSASRYDVAVVGAGVFGAWIAYTLQRSGRSVLLLDAHGPGNSRASSGDESRIIRMGYGTDDIYTQWAIRSLELWRDFAQDCGETLLVPTGVLWLARDADPRVMATMVALEAHKVRHRQLSRADLRAEYPQIELDGIGWGVLESDSGVLMARRAVRAVVRKAVELGLIYQQARVEAPGGTQPVDALGVNGADRIRAHAYVFACGPWLPTLFPALLEGRINPTRQEVFFFGSPGGDERFTSPHIPAWIDFDEGIYGAPDLEHRGLKIGFDRHGPPIDPERDDRIPSQRGVRDIREVLARRFPAMAGAPLVEARVCQYENTSNGDFLIDIHPSAANVWLVGGGSGHGFKHAPAVAEYVAARLDGRIKAEPRFSLMTKEKAKERKVY